jgi:peroxisomal 3,2-trans-enoyl-CoA isomerase
MSSPPQSEGVLVEKLSESVVLLSYNRPKFSNAFTAQQYDELREVLAWVKNEAAVRVIVM